MIRLLFSATDASDARKRRMLQIGILLLAGVGFGAANLAALLFVMAVKRYAFTSLWCAYAAFASIIILAYFWRTKSLRPFLYTKHA